MSLIKHEVMLDRDRIVERSKRIYNNLPHCGMPIIEIGEESHAHILVATSLMGQINHWTDDDVQEAASKVIHYLHDLCQEKYRQKIGSN